MRTGRSGRREILLRKGPAGRHSFPLRARKGELIPSATPVAQAAGTKQLRATPRSPSEPRSGELRSAALTSSPARPLASGASAAAALPGPWASGCRCLPLPAGCRNMADCGAPRGSCLVLHPASQGKRASQ